MIDKELKNYIYDMKRVGLDNRQIATKLGMDVKEFNKICESAFETEKPAKVVLQEKPKPVEKPVSGAAEPKPVPKQVDEFMNEPILGKEKTEIEAE